MIGSSLLLLCATAAARTPAPALRVARWAGSPVDPARPGGKVTVLVFFSPHHPQTGKLLPRLCGLCARHQARGLRLAGIAAASDVSKLRGLPFPVALDPRRKTLALYRASHLPWVVFVDRYGRVAFAGALSAGGNTFARAETALRLLLAEPTYATLVRRRATRKLSGLHTRKSVTALFTLGARKELQELLPRRFLDAGLDAARQRWNREKESYRYSIRHARFRPLMKAR